MRIKNLITSNFTGRDFNDIIGPVTLITGPNYAGKSAKLNAIKIGLLGYHPRLGKQPGSTFSFAGENRSEMNIALAFDNDKVATHSWKRKTDGGVSYNPEMPFEIPVVLLDTKDYFERTAQQRVKFVFDKIDPSKFGFNDAELIARLNKIEVVPAIYSKKGVDAVIALVNETISYRDTTKLSAQGWMDVLIEKLKEEQKKYNTLWKRTSTQVSSYRSTLPKTKPTDKQPELDAVIKEMEALNTEISKLEQANEIWESNQKKRNELQTALNASTIPDTREKLKQDISAMEEKVRSYKSETPLLAKQHAEAKGRYDALKESQSKVDSEIKAIEQKIIDLDTTPHCPFCKSDTEGWAAKIKDVYNQDFTLKNQEYESLENEIQDLIKSGIHLKTSLTTSKTVDQAIQKISNDLSIHRKALSEQEEIFATIDKHKAELAGLNSIGTKPDVSGLNDLKIKISNLISKRAELEDIQQALKIWNTTIDSANKAEADYTENFTFAEVFKLAIKATVDYQESLVGAAFSYILDKAVALTDGILKARLDYRAGELGMHQDTGWVSHETFSGTEELLAYSGLQVALAQDSPIKIVMMDELGRLTSENKVKLIERMINLVKTGVIDQFIGIDVEDKPYRRFVNDITFITP